MGLADKLRSRREKYEDAGVAQKIDRSNVENILERLKILKKKKRTGKKKK